MTLVLVNFSVVVNPWEMEGKKKDNNQVLNLLT